MKFRQVIKILKILKNLKKPNWEIRINSISIGYRTFEKFDKGHFTVGRLFTFNKISRKDLLNGLKQAKTVYIWGYGKIPKLVLKMAKYYQNRGMFDDEIPF